MINNNKIDQIYSIYRSQPICIFCSQKKTNEFLWNFGFVWKITGTEIRWEQIKILVVGFFQFWVDWYVLYVIKLNVRWYLSFLNSPSCHIILSVDNYSVFVSYVCICLIHKSVSMKYKLINFALHHTAHTAHDHDELRKKNRSFSQRTDIYSSLGFSHALSIVN